MKTLLRVVATVMLTYGLLMATVRRPAQTASVSPTVHVDQHAPGPDVREGREQAFRNDARASTTCR